MTSEPLNLYRSALQQLVSSQAVAQSLKICCYNLVKTTCREKAPSRGKDMFFPAPTSHNQAQNTRIPTDDLKS